MVGGRVEASGSSRAQPLNCFSLQEYVLGENLVFEVLENLGIFMICKTL